MTVDTKEVVTTIAYLIGVCKSVLRTDYSECAELLESLSANRETTIIRYLCKLRTVLEEVEPRSIRECLRRKQQPQAQRQKKPRRHEQER